jgi:hypothetical protein
MKNLYGNLCFALSLILAGSSFASENPVYSEINAEVKLPAVTVDGRPGFYQDITLRFEDSDSLRMISVNQGVLLNHIHRVDVVQTSTFPAQVFLAISGAFPSGCGAIGQIHQNRHNNNFSVQVYFQNDAWLANPLLVACTLAIRPFEKVIPLKVYGLAAGVYEYKLNAEFSGSFTLVTDNSLQ